MLYLGLYRQLQTSLFLRDSWFSGGFTVAGLLEDEKIKEMRAVLGVSTDKWDGTTLNVVHRV